MGNLLQKLAKALMVVAMTALPASCMYSNVHHPANRQTMAEKLEDETIVLVNKEESDDTSSSVSLRPYCAGVWISRDAILTAGHCVADLGKPAVQVALEQLGLSTAEFPEWDPVGSTAFFALHQDLKTNNVVDTYYEGTVEQYDKADDLALVKVSSRFLPKHPVARLSKADIRDGDEVHIVGHPRGILWTYIHGFVSSTRYVKHPLGSQVDVLQVSAPIWMGNSGGGAFDADGDIIGVCSFLVQVPNTGFFIHRDVVHQFLSHNKVSGY